MNGGGNRVCGPLPPPSTDTRTYPTQSPDLKPANLLLKSNPHDYRGFTVKLADFGFVLHLAEVIMLSVSCHETKRQSIGSVITGC